MHCLSLCLRLSVSASVSASASASQPQPHCPLSQAPPSSRLCPNPDQVLCLLRRYRGLVPETNDDFNAFFETIHPGRRLGGNPLYGIGWYNVWRYKYGNENEGLKAREVHLARG